MTDTHAPTTGSQPAPMFDTGPLPSPNPHTEPSPLPIFDTGPHPDPLRALGDSAPEPAPEPVVELAPEPAPGIEPQPEAAEAELQAPAVPAEAEPQPEPLPEPAESAPQAFSELDNVDTDAYLRSVTGHLPPVAIPAQPIAVAGTYEFVKRWQFALIVAGVWFVAAAAGLGFYYWWYTALFKTLPVFGILLYLAGAMVASVLVSLVPNRPQVTATAIALMGAPFASTAAAAVLHGAYFFEWIARPVIG